MSLYTMSSTDGLPFLPKPDGLWIEKSTDPLLLSVLVNISVEEARRRMANDHLAFVAYIGNSPAAFGWMARGKADIGELNHEFVLPMGHRYLWNFRTLPEFKGRGIYPALLQYIIRYESRKADRFWIIHAPENKASLRGIVKAGFRHIGRLYVDITGNMALEAGNVSGADRELLQSMGFYPSGSNAASCWNCSSPYLKKREPGCCCSGLEAICTNSSRPALF